MKIRTWITTLSAAALVAAGCTLCLASQAPEKKPVATAHQKAASQGSKLQAMLEQKEKAGWEAFKNKDAQSFNDLATDNYTAVLADGNGEHDRPATLAAMKQITINSYTLTDFKLIPVAPGAALLSYKASANYSIAGSAAQDYKLAISDLWVKRGGQWKSLRYHETEMK